MADEVMTCAPEGPAPSVTQQLQQEIDALCSQFGMHVRNREVLVEEHERQIKAIDQQIEETRRAMHATATVLNEMKKRGVL